MALPEQIRKQSEAVQELYRQMNSGDEPAGNDKPAGDTPADDQQQQPADEQPARSDASPPPDEQRGGERVPAEETVLQKYKTLQGMYNAEVPRLHQQNRELTQRLTQLEQLLAAQPAPHQQQPKPADQQPQRLVSEKEVEEYGDSLDVMRRVTREELGSFSQRLAAIEGFMQQIQSSTLPQIQRVEQRQVQSAEQLFWSELSGAVSNWREINDNPDFQSWLMQADPLTGITRQTYLEDAQRALDARRVSNFFRTWLEMSGQAAVAQPTNGAKTAAASELERQVAPGRSKNTGNQTQAKGKMYTREDIRVFFDDVRRGEYKGREAERNRIESDIFAAQREGRIQPDA